MDPLALLVCFVIWLVATHGLVYLMVRALITQPLRVRLAGIHDFFLNLLSCDRCAGGWAGMIIYCLILAVGACLGWFSHWTDLCIAGLALPLAAASGIGLEDLYYRIAPPEEESTKW